MPVSPQWILIRGSTNRQRPDAGRVHHGEKNPNQSALPATSTLPPPNETSTTGRATRRPVDFFPTNAPGLPICCNADGTTRCVMRLANGMVRTPGGPIADKLVHWIGDGGLTTGCSTKPPSKDALDRTSTDNTVSACQTMHRSPLILTAGEEKNLQDTKTYFHL